MPSVHLSVSLSYSLTSLLISAPLQAKPGHIYNRFTWGNKRSLWDEPRAAGIDVRERVLAYYK